MRRGGKDNPVSLFAFQDIITAVMGIILLLVLLLCLCLVQLPDKVVHGNTEEQQEKNTKRLASLKKELNRLRSNVPNNNINPSDMSEAELDDEVAKQEKAIKNLEQANSTMKKKLEEDKANQGKYEKQLQDKQSDLQEINQLEQKIKEDRAKLKEIKKENRQYYNFNDNQKLPWIIDLYKDKCLVLKANSKEKPMVFSQRSFRGNAVVNWIKKKGIQKEYFLFIVRAKTIRDFQIIEIFVDKNDADIGVEMVGDDVKVLNENGIID